LAGVDFVANPVEFGLCESVFELVRGLHAAELHLGHASEHLGLHQGLLIVGLRDGRAAFDLTVELGQFRRKRLVSRFDFRVDLGRQGRFTLFDAVGLG
jgi:hypothetical protein